MDILKLTNCMTATVALLRHLEATDTTVTYADFARRVGILEPDEVWHCSARPHISNTLNGLAALCRMSKVHGALDFSRVVTARDGLPGTGYFHDSTIKKGH